MKYQGAFSRIVGFAGKRFLFSPSPPRSTFFFFAPALTFGNHSIGNACYTGYAVRKIVVDHISVTDYLKKLHRDIIVVCVTFLLPFILVFMNTSVISSSHGKEEAVHSKLCKSGKWRPLRCIKGDCRHSFLTDENKQTNKKTYDWLSDLKLYR